MNKNRKDIVEYIIALVNEFAQEFELSDLQAYQYISRFNGIEMIERHYGIMHTLDFQEAVRCLAIYCNRHSVDYGLSGIEKGLKDIQDGLIYHADNIDYMIRQILEDGSYES